MFEKEIKKQKVLIVGPDYFNFLPAVESSFCMLGWDTVVDSYDNPIHPYTRFMKWAYKLNSRKGRAKMQEKSRENYNRHLLQLFNEEAPQLVFIMNGDIIFPETLDRMKADAKVALWLFDNLSKLPTSEGHVDHVTGMFCFEQDDVDHYLKQDKTAFFLPQACDSNTYRPLGLEKDIDILFVGNLYRSEKRQKAIKAVIDAFPDKVIRVYGEYKPWYKGFYKWLTREHRDIYANHSVAPDEVNRLYNRSRVVLNIHQEEQTNGANPRTFEICGSGAWQVCDANPYTELLFKDGGVGLYHSEQEMLALIADGLSRDMSADAARAYDLVARFHSFDERIRLMLQYLDMQS